MIRMLALAAGLGVAGAAGAWALSTAVPRAAELLSSAGWDGEGGASPPAYQIRLELPQTRRPEADGTEFSADGGLPDRPDLALESAPLAVEAGTQPPPARAAAAQSPRSGLLDMDFDIATFGKEAPAIGSRTIRTSKPLNHGGNRVGSVDLALGQGSVVSVDRHALQTLVAGKDDKIAAALAAMEGEMVSFDALRDRGIRIRYDPLADAVVIDGGA